MRIGLIGCGEIARRGHLPALTALRGFSVEAVADQEPERARRVAREFDIPKVYQTAKELIQDPSVEAVVATTPPPAYKDIVTLASACYKPVLLEKPLALNLADAQYVAGNIKESGIKVGVVQNLRYYPALREMKKRVGEGLLGRLSSMHLVLHAHSPLSWSLSKWRFEGSSGVLNDIGVHAFDALTWLSGSSPKRVTAFGSTWLPQAKFLNQVCALVEFESGTVGFVDLSWLTGQMLFKVNLMGTGGRLFSDVLFNQVDEQHGRPLPLADTRLLMDKFLFILRGAINGQLFTGALQFYQPLYQDFLSYVNGETSDFVGVDAAQVTVRIMDAVSRSLATSSAVEL